MRPNGDSAARSTAAEKDEGCIDCGAGGELDREKGGCGPLCKMDRLVKSMRGGESD